MSKNNLFLGMASGSVGDVTFYRRNGAQIARARNRSPKNPKSTGQATQRAFFSPVARFFAPLATVLETSFEGLSRSASYSKFLSDNIKAARNNGWYVPKGAPFWPLPYTLSKGTLAPINIEWTDAGRILFLSPGSEDYGAPVGSVGHLSRAMVAQGYKNGDQITIITVKPDGVGGYYPAWFRFNLNIDSFEHAPDVLANSAMYVVYERGKWYISDVDDEVPTMVAGAVIVSRFENGIWRRSTQSLVLSDTAIETITGAAAMARAIDSYRGSQGVPISDVYLNGGTASDSGARYVGSVITSNDISGLVDAYLTSIGRTPFVVDEEGSTVDLLTVSGVGVSTGEVINNAAVCVGIAGAGDNLTGYFVSVDVDGGNVSYSQVAVTGRDSVIAILPRINCYALDDQYQANTRAFLIASGVPANVLDFAAGAIVPMIVDDAEYTAYSDSNGRRHLVSFDYYAAPYNDGVITVGLPNPITEISQFTSFEISGGIPVEGLPEEVVDQSVDVEVRYIAFNEVTKIFIVEIFSGETGRSSAPFSVPWNGSTVDVVVPANIFG